MIHLSHCLRRLGTFAEYISFSQNSGKTEKYLCLLVVIDMTKTLRVFSVFGEHPSVEFLHGFLALYSDSSVFWL